MRNERLYVIEAIEAFLNGSGGEWDWDDFTSCSLRSAKLDNIRRRADAVALPLDSSGEAELRKLLDEAVHLIGYDVTKPKPWRMGTGIVVGSLIGALVWWSSHVPGAGLFQNPQLILFPIVMGILVVTLRNKRKKVGSFDPETVAQNRKGRV